MCGCGVGVPKVINKNKLLLGIRLMETNISCHGFDGGLTAITIWKKRKIQKLLGGFRGRFFNVGVKIDLTKQSHSMMS